MIVVTEKGHKRGGQYVTYTIRQVTGKHVSNILITDMGLKSRGQSTLYIISYKYPLLNGSEQG